MNLQLTFSEPLPDEKIVSITDGNGNLLYRFIPIETVKEMLSQDFHKWGTGNFQYSFLQHGHDLICNASVVLELEYVDSNEHGDTTMKFNFVGATTFNVNKYLFMDASPNDNYLAVALTECIKNAAKNIGVRYGFKINENKNLSDIVSTTPTTKKPKDPVKETINQITKKI